MKKYILIHFILILTFADLRINNDQLIAQGQWKVQYYPDKNQISSLKYKNVTPSNSTSQNQTIIQQKPIEQANIFQHFINKNGQCICFFFDSNLKNAFQNNKSVDTLSIRFHDPKYVDQKLLILKIDLSNYLNDTDDWEDKYKRANYSYIEQLEVKQRGSTNISYKVDQGNIELYMGDYKASIKYFQKQQNYIFPIAILILDCFLLYMTIRFEKKNISAQKISIITLFHTIFFLIFLSTFFLIVGMAQLPNVMSILLLCGCLQILISVKLIRKFQTIIQRVSTINGYCFFYCGIFAYIWCLFNYFYTPLFIIINSLFLIPQIIHSIRYGNKLEDQYQYLIIVSSSQLYFLYLKGYPDNILRYHPQILVCIAIFLLVGAQIWIVINQDRRGPFFFIKKSWLNYYEYYQTFNLDSKSELYEQQCSICLCSLAQQDPFKNLQTGQQTEEQLKNKNKNLHKIKKITLMVTPCGHKFHKSCLEQWAQLKRQCPVDRSVLPVIYK